MYFGAFSIYFLILFGSPWGYRSLVHSGAIASADAAATAAAIAVIVIVAIAVVDVLAHGACVKPSSIGVAQTFSMQRKFHVRDMYLFSFT